MNTNEGEVIHVEANSLEDYARGKRLFQKYSDIVNRHGGAKYSELISMGVVEGGTKSGGPSCIFLALHEGEKEDGSEDQFFVFETTASGLQALAAAIPKCQEYFTKNQGAKQ